MKNAYFPTDSAVPIIVALHVVTAVLLGFACVQRWPGRSARPVAWASVIALLTSMDRVCVAQPAGFRMLALISVGLVAMKAPVAIESIAAGAPRLSFARWLCFSVGWFGMAPRVFAERIRLAGAPALFARGARSLLLGAAFVIAARVAWERTASRALATCLILPGISLILHFGILNLSAAAWRVLGFDCQPLFRAPLLAESLGEFWGRRWNLAFSEMTAVAVYRPLTKRVGRPSATVAAFVFSGLLHEMAISLPVRAGFGLPMLYFVVQGCLVLVERRLLRGGHPVHGWRGRLWTLAWVAAPLPLLFHECFLEGVIWPLLGTVSAR